MQKPAALPEKVLKERAPLTAEPLSYDTVIVPPFYGSSEVLRWDPNQILEKIDKEELYKGYWRAGNLSPETFIDVPEKDFEEALSFLSGQIITLSLLEPRGLYAFYPVITDDETIILLDPEDFRMEVLSLVFPRLEHRKGRSIADFIRPEGDVIAFQVVTIGEKMSLKSSEYFAENKYMPGFFLNGLGNYLTEEMADRVTSEIKRAVFVPANQGRRYGFGYPGLPGIEKIDEMLHLLSTEDRLGVTVTDNLQIIPEQSTATMYVHHAQAAYG
jgi:5-methyltetrahydrofolate--homocysteine methyltransferase